MTGVEILFAEEITRSVWNAFVWDWGLVILALIGLILIGVVIYTSWKGTATEGDITIMSVFAIVLLVISGVCFYFNGTIPVYDHTEYKITVDESADMNEFFEKYELIKVEGKIYHVKNEERLNEEN